MTPSYTTSCQAAGDPAYPLFFTRSSCEYLKVTLSLVKRIFESFFSGS
jgi:hypothetical protein